MFVTNKVLSNFTVYHFVILAPAGEIAETPGFQAHFNGSFYTFKVKDRKKKLRPKDRESILCHDLVSCIICLLLRSDCSDGSEYVLLSEVRNKETHSSCEYAYGSHCEKESDWIHIVNQDLFVHLKSS